MKNSSEALFLETISGQTGWCIKHVKIPQQSGGSECGTFVCFYITIGCLGQFGSMIKDNCSMFNSSDCESFEGFGEFHVPGLEITS